jgi:hypothetical protein
MEVLPDLQRIDRHNQMSRCFERAAYAPFSSEVPGRSAADEYQ